MLDGQMAVVDDYLAVRPEAEATLRRLAAQGRLAVGPWYILMDEFLVSGETIVRNLQLGMERATAFGGAMPVGYLPDMFGHIAQMPQLLRQAGFEHAVVWRGVPSAIDRNGFWWTAPDGSTVRAEYLPPRLRQRRRRCPTTPRRWSRRIARPRRASWATSCSAPILWMNGTDHQVPQPWLGRVVAEANDLQDDYRARRHVAGRLPRPTAPTDGPAGVDGRAALGRARQPAHGRGVEPGRREAGRGARRARARAPGRAAVARCSCPPSAGRARCSTWRGCEVIRNSAHDSICACSIDEVVDAVLHRYAEARQIADGLDHVVPSSALGRSMAEPGTVVVNPIGPAPRSGWSSSTSPGDDVPEGTQVAARRARRHFAGRCHHHAGRRGDGDPRRHPQPADRRVDLHQHRRRRRDRRGHQHRHPRRQRGCATTCSSRT